MAVEKSKEANSHTKQRTLSSAGENRALWMSEKSPAPMSPERSLAERITNSRACFDYWELSKVIVWRARSGATLARIFTPVPIVKKILCFVEKSVLHNALLPSDGAGGRDYRRA